MAKQTFTAGQTLTAQQMNDLQTNDFNLSVSTQTANYTLQAADKGTREVANAGSAITFTVPNNVFAAGDIVDIHNINTGLLTLAAGTGMTLSSADVLTVNQWQGGTLYFTSASASIWFPRAKTVSAGGFVYLTGATFAAQTTVAFANDTFTSTYDFYLVMLEAGADSTFATVTLQVRDNTGTKTAASYNGGSSITIFSGTETNIGTNGQTSFPLQGTQSGENRTAWNIWVATPANALKRTKFFGTATADPTTGASIGGLHFGGTYSVNEAHTGLVFTFSNASTGLYRVYGLSNS